MSPHLRVLDSGMSTLIQDRGRRGYAALGIGVSGALDASSAAAANRLVGNHADAAVLEVLLGGLTLAADKRVLLTVTGAQCPVIVDGTVHPTDCLITVRAGERITVGAPSHGLRSYLAVRGGIDSPVILGSRSRDTMSQIGPRPLAPGDLLAVGADVAGFPAADLNPLRASPAPRAEVVRAEFTLGPRDAWFTSEAIALLQRADWRVSPASDRVGVRLLGPILRRDARLESVELPSEGAALGSIQVTPSGPIVFHRDHPVTGGYPILGVVDEPALDALAQARAGKRVRFVLV